MREQIAQGVEKEMMNGLTRFGTEVANKKMGKEPPAPLCHIYNEPVTNKYTVLEEIGRGKFAVVRKCSHNETGGIVAAKFIRKRRKGKSARDSILQEVMMLEVAQEHPRLVDLLEVYETQSEVVVITEYCAGGELFYECVIEESFKESDVIGLVRQIIDGLIYLHDRNIVHLDLKPQNILLTKPFPEGKIKLCDFGFACLLNSGEEVREILGTADYVAPEVLNYEPISLATDIWSLGVLTYVMLTACSPFTGKCQQETFMNITLGKLEFPDDLFGDISLLAQDFMRSLLVQDPKKRLTARHCLEHPWLKGENWETSVPAETSSCSLEVNYELDLGDISGIHRTGHNYHIQQVPNKRHKCNGTLVDLPPPTLQAEKDKDGVKNSSDVELKNCVSNGSPLVAAAAVHNTDVDKENQPVGVLPTSPTERHTDKHTANGSDKTEPSIGK